MIGMAAKRSKRRVAENGGSRYSKSLMYAAAKLYYEDDVRQNDTAERLELSPATVSGCSGRGGCGWCASRSCRPRTTGSAISHAA